MAELKHVPVRHHHKAFLARAGAREGFKQACAALDIEYQIVDQLLKARTRAGLTKDAGREARMFSG